MPNVRLPSDNPLRTPEQWADVLRAVPAAVFLVGPDGAIVYANDEAARLTGYTVGELTSLDLGELVPESPRDARRADGSTFPAAVGLSSVTVDGVRYTAVTLRDETERRRSEQELLRRALHDPLTGLPNRVLFADRLAQALARVRRADHQLAVLYLDLNGFKDVNDTFGHAVGDEVLEAVGRRLAAALRPGDTVARFGGDEFLVLCEALKGEQEAVEVARRLLEALGPPVQQRKGAVPVSASVGIAMSAGAGDTPGGLVEAADRAMYRAKRAGGPGWAMAPGRGAG